MVFDAKEKTAPNTSVGADERQSDQITNNIIPISDAEFNDLNENSTESLEEMYRQMRRFTDPYYLHTVSLTELYQTAYNSRPSIIDGLLYREHISSQALPRSASPSWWHKSHIMSAQEKSCGTTTYTPAQFSTLPWRTITSESKVECL